MSYKDLSLVKYQSFHHSILENQIQISKEIKNTILLDQIKINLKKNNYSLISQNYDSLVLLKNDLFFFQRITCRPLNIRAIYIKIIFNVQNLNKILIIYSHNLQQKEFNFVCEKIEEIMKNSFKEKIEKKNITFFGKSKLYNKNVFLEEENIYHKNKNLQLYTNKIQISKIIFTINYSIGKKLFHFLKEIKTGNIVSFNYISNFFVHTIDSIFKDYNLNKKENKWVSSSGQFILEELICDEIFDKLESVYNKHLEYFKNFNFQPITEISDPFLNNIIYLLKNQFLLFLKVRSFYGKIDVLEDIYFILNFEFCIIDGEEDGAKKDYILKQGILKTENIFKLLVHFKIVYEFHEEIKARILNEEFLQCIDIILQCLVNQ